MSPAHLDDAHRKSEVARLLALLLREEEGLRIAGISGPGGVGKSYLLSHVLAAAGVASQRWLRLSVDGSNEGARGDFFALVEGQIARRRLPPPAPPKNDYFPHVRKVAKIHRALVESVVAELKAGPAPQEIKDAAVALLMAGRRLNQVVPKTREFLDVSATKLEPIDLTQTFDEAWKVLSSMRALRDSSVLPGPIRDALGLGYKERVKSDLYGVTADALVTDLSAAVVGYRKEDRFRLTQSPIPDVERVVLVVDDFEALAPALEEFLVSSLIPRLAEAPFPTLMILIGRDDLEAMHPHWGQHCKKYIRDQIRLAPFDRESAMDLLARSGVPPERREELYQTTQGFPFLLSLLIEELGEAGADSALFLRKFYDRTTRWMSVRERAWFERVCYLDKVNLDSLAPLFPEDSVESVQDWFEHEASIRDPSAAVFQVRPLIREKVLRYLELRSPSRHREMMERGAKISA
jgi:hypothetical protein